MSRYLIPLALLLGVTSLGACPPDDEKVQVKVLAILASEHHKEVAPKLAEFAKHVQKKDKSLTGFRIGRTTDEKLKVGEGKKIPLVDEVQVEVKVSTERTEDGRIKLTIVPPKMGPITYVCACDVYFPIATQHYVGKGKNEERLFIAIMAKPCVSKKAAKK
jgi:hypothetical protein